MSSKSNLRRQLSGYCFKIDDCISVLNHHLAEDNFADGAALTELMKELPDMSLTELNVATERAERSQLITEVLLRYLKTYRKYKESNATVIIFIFLVFLITRLASFNMCV